MNFSYLPAKIFLKWCLVAVCLFTTFPLASQDLPEGLSALPELLEFVGADFPIEALDEDVQADVLIRIAVDVEGRVVSAEADAVILYLFDENNELVEQEVTPGSDSYGFVTLALEAIGGFVFSPALDEEGNAVPVELVWRYGFYFSDEETEVSVNAVEEGAMVGVLLERGTDIPILDVELSITLSKETFSTRSDELGLFEFEGLTPGEWQVTASVPGYEDFTTIEPIEAGIQSNITYRLEAIIDTSYEFEVRSGSVSREISRETVTATEINRIPGNNGDVIKVIQNLPGFARSPFNGGLIVIRGSAPEDSRVFIQGVESPLIFHFGGLTSVLSNEVIEEIEYLPGAFSVEYGRATGGVINAEIKDPSQTEYHGVVDIDVYDTSLFLEGPLGDSWSFLASGRRSYIDVILPAILPDDVLNLTVAPRYWDYQFKLKYDHSLVHDVSMTLFGSDDRLSFLLEETPSDPSVRGEIETGTSFHTALFEWSTELSENLSTQVSLSAGTQSLFFFLSDDLRFDLDTRPLSLRATVNSQLHPRLGLRGGLDFGSGYYNLSIRLPRSPREGEFPLALGASEVYTEEYLDEWLLSPAEFIEARWEAIPALYLTTGFRAEQYIQTSPNRDRVFSDFVYDGRFAFDYEFNDRWMLKGSVGNFHVPPTPEEFSSGFGNPDLSTESAIHYVLGVEHRPTNYLNLELQLFYKDLFDLVSQSNQLLEVDGELVPEVYNNNGQGRVYGAEVLLRHELANNFFGWLAYTLSRTERRDSADDPYRLFTFDQTHILTLIGSYEFGDSGWAVGTRFRYVSGNLQTPVVGSVFDADNDIYIRIPGESNSERLPAFHQLDFRIDKSWLFERWGLDAFIDIANVYNRMNPEAVDYNYDFSEQVYTNGLPIIPSLGVRGWF
jgi:outer membrane receptor protein involved in Fe transport